MSHRIAHVLIPKRGLNRGDMDTEDPRTYRLLGRIWVDIRSKRQTQTDFASQTVSDTTHIATTEFSETSRAVTGDMILKIGGEQYEVVSADNFDLGNDKVQLLLKRYR